MAKQLQIRGGTTVQHSTFTGALREITIDTDKDVVVVHDGTTVGGFPLAKQTSVDSKVTKVTSTDNAVVRFNGTTGDVQNSGVIIDDNNNVGIGVTPSAWISNGTVNALHLNRDGVIYSGYVFNNNHIAIGSGHYYNSSFTPIRKNNYAVGEYAQANGGHYWYTAPSGTAGNAITWNTAMTLNSSGNLLVGTTTDNGVDKLQVNGSISAPFLSGFRVLGSGNPSAYTGGYRTVKIVTTNGDGGDNTADVYVNIKFGPKAKCIAAFDQNGNSVSPSTVIPNTAACTFVAIVCE